MNIGLKGERRKEKGERRKEKGKRRKTVRGIYPDGALPLFIGGGDHEVVRGCKNAPHGITPNYSLLTTHLKSHPLTAKAVPSPYKQGASAIRINSPHGLSPL